MKIISKLATWIYRLLISLYPRQFRSQFGAEMQHVFGARLAAAMEHGPVNVVVTCLHELAGACRGLIREHASASHPRLSSKQVALLMMLLIGLSGLALMFRERTFSFFCDLANMEGGGLANQAACTIFRLDPAGRYIPAIALVAVMPLLWLSLRDMTHLGLWNRQCVRRYTWYVGVAMLCGVIAQLSLRWMRLIPIAPGLMGLLYVATIWLIPALAPAMVEMRRTRRAAIAAPTMMIVWLAETQAYTLCWAALLAFGIGGAQLEDLQIVGTGTANIEHFLTFLRFHVGNLMWQRAGFAIMAGAVLGNLFGLFNTWLNPSLQSESRP